MSRVTKSVIVMLAASSLPAFGIPLLPATIVDLPGGCGGGIASRTTLQTALTTAGYAVGVSTAGVPSLTGQIQVWDLRCQTVLSEPDIAAYTAYLAGGGSLFLMGENLGFAGARDLSLTGFIQSLGGGTLTLGSAGNLETVQPPFTGPAALTTVTFQAIGGTTTAGTGAFIAKDNTGVGGALVFGPGALSATPTGTLIVVLDVNFLATVGAK
jgi:hypothetical protein